MLGRAYYRHSVAAPEQAPLHRGTFEPGCVLVWQARVAAPERAALHRGIGGGDDPLYITQVAAPERAALHPRREGGGAGAAGQPVAAPKRAALHRGALNITGAPGYSLSPPLSGRPFIEAPPTRAALRRLAPASPFP